MAGEHEEGRVEGREGEREETVTGEWREEGCGGTRQIEGKKGER